MMFIGTVQDKGEHLIYVFKTHILNVHAPKDVKFILVFT